MLQLVGLVHFWARNNASTNVSLFGLLTVPAMCASSPAHLAALACLAASDPFMPLCARPTVDYPPFLLLLDILQNGPFALGCAAVAVAHLYWFLTTNPSTAPACRVMTEPPAWWRSSFAPPPAQVRVAGGTAMRGGGGRAPAAAGGSGGSGGGGGGHTWGSGNRLGR